MAHHYIYIGKRKENILTVAKKVFPTKHNKSVKKTKGCFLIPHLPACDELKAALDSSEQTLIAEKMNELVKFCNERYSIIGNHSVTFLIHFGNQGIKDCRNLSVLMANVKEEQKSLDRFCFIAVSRANEYPETYWQDGMLHIPSGTTAGEEEHPDDPDLSDAHEDMSDPALTLTDPPASPTDVPREGIVQDRNLIDIWRQGKSEIPDYDHLRAICILCKALLTLPEEKRKEKVSSSIWWIKGIWGESMPEQDIGFSDAEKELEKRFGELLETFCESILTRKEIPEKYSKQENLEEIVKKIQNLLLNPKG